MRSYGTKALLGGLSLMMTIPLTQTIREGDMDCGLTLAFVQVVPPVSYEVQALYKCPSGLLGYCHEHVIVTDGKILLQQRLCQGWTPPKPPTEPMPGP